jgi:hypothetical protein
MKVVLPRTKPYALLCYEALFRSLLSHLRENKTLRDEFGIHQAGYRGEKNADYVLSTYPHKSAYIFQGIRLKAGPFNFQIDTLMVTSSFILILEIKNFKGEIEYNPKTHQIIQFDGDQKKSQKNPILQAEAQKRHLTYWLQQSGFPPIPIETLGVSVNPSSILTYRDESVSAMNFIQLDSLPTSLDNLYKTYTKNIYDSGTIQKLNRKLLRNNTPHKPNFIKQFNIADRHLIKGISCIDCQSSPLQYKGRKWICHRCGKKDSKAHEQKILDYFLLFDPTISNRVCREILQINSPKVARRLLYSLNLDISGKYYARKYHSPPLDKFPQDSFITIEKRSIFNE